MNASTPALIVVTGRPGSGKTTLARKLVPLVRCPLISRDEIKEGFINTTRATDDIGREIYRTFFDTIRLLLDRRVTLVAEAAFQHKLWAPQLEPLRSIARLRIVVCQVDPALARSRHIDRGMADPERQRYHDDDVMRAAREGKTVPIGEYVPPQIERVPTSFVDTSNPQGPDLNAVHSFVRG